MLLWFCSASGWWEVSTLLQREAEEFWCLEISTKPTSAAEQATPVAKCTCASPSICIITRRSTKEEKNKARLALYFHLNWMKQHSVRRRLSTRLCKETCWLFHNFSSWMWKWGALLQRPWRKAQLLQSWFSLERHTKTAISMAYQTAAAASQGEVQAVRVTRHVCVSDSSASKCAIWGVFSLNLDSGHLRIKSRSGRRSSETHSTSSAAVLRSIAKRWWAATTPRRMHLCNICAFH